MLLPNTPAGRINKYCTYLNSLWWVSLGIWTVVLLSFANLLYVLAGFFLGKWESDRSQIVLWAGIKDLKISTMHMETMRAKVHRWMKESARERGEELPPMPFVEMDQPIEMETKWLDEALKRAKKSVKYSLSIAILCLVAGSVLFALSLML